MKIFVINLERNPLRWRRMAEQLRGLDFARVDAVDGKSLAGPEFRERAIPPSAENLSRYERGCILSHRRVWETLLAGSEDYVCVLEDDVLLSGDFARFVKNADWIPAGANLIKLETTRQKVVLQKKFLPAPGRRLVQMESLHFGSAGYIISRHAARLALALTARPELPLDRLLFGDAGRKKLQPVRQLVPAICIQNRHAPQPESVPELQSLIQPSPPPKRCKILPEKFCREFLRLFREFHRPVSALQRFWRGQRRVAVPFE